MTLRSGFTGVFLFGCFVLACGVGLSTGPQKDLKNLFTYIQEGKRLGLQEAQIRKNALIAGWDQATVEQAYSLMRLMNSDHVAPGSLPRSPAAVSEAYRIGAGDVLQIAVWKEPEASVPSAVVRADGRITVPLIAEVDAAGLTPTELEKSLVEKLSKYINHPVVTVVPAAINSKRVYVVGGVRKEGPINLLRPMTVLQAINEAGGLAEFAKKKKIYVLRNQNGRQTKLPFNYQAVIKGERLEQNVALLPDDTIVVPD